MTQNSDIAKLQQQVAPARTLLRIVRGAIAGLAVGWIIGMIWWSSLMISFGPSVRVTVEGGHTHEEQVTVLSRVSYAPLTAIPWGLAGWAIGGVIGWLGGWLEIVATVAGLLAGLLLALAVNPYDGWLTITMPINAAAGAFIGLVIGLVVRTLVRVAGARSKG